MPPPNDNPRPSKRSRISESCKLCRAKKTRCDGRRPKCSPCSSKNIPCEYSEPNVPIPSDILAIIARLDERVQQLEGESAARSSAASASTIQLRNEQPVMYPDNPTVRFISSVVETSLTDENHNDFRMHHGLNQIISPNSRVPHQVSLPPREIADDLVDSYERIVYPLFPVLHLPTFKKQYLQLWEWDCGTRAVDKTFEATINIVFALGCINSSKIDKSTILETASTFYERARGIMPIDSLDSPRIEVVQYLLLTGNYLSFTKYSHRYCNVMAVAIQVAKTIGLHQAQKQFPPNQLQQEMEKRVWHLCLTMQRLMSSLFGWSSIVTHPHDNTCPIPETIDDEYLLEEGTGIQPAGKPSLLDALIISIRIFNVVAEAHKVNLTSYTAEPKIPEMTRIIELNEKLNTIEADLPHHLKYDSEMGDSPRDKILRFQAEVTTLRIIYVRLLFQRPTLLAVARQLLISREPLIPKSHLEVTLRDEICQICVQNALLALDILHTNLESPSKIISAHALHVTLSAAAVLIASSIVPSIGAKLEEPTSPHALGVKKTFEILEAHEPRVEGASETRNKLQQLLEIVKNATQLQQGGRVQNNSEEEERSTQLLDSQGDLFSGIDFTTDLWDPILDSFLYM